MTPIWHGILQQIVFFAGIFALTVAALDEVHLAPTIEPSTKVAYSGTQSAADIQFP